MKRINISLTKEQIAKLKRMAKKSGMSMALLIRLMIDATRERG